MTTGNESTRGAQGKSKTRIICVEEHWETPELDEMTKKWRARTGLPLHQDHQRKTLTAAESKAMDIDEFRLPLMDKFGITMQVLSTGSPGVQGIEDSPTAIRVAKKANDEMAEIIRKYPSRFAGFASLPTQDPRAAADELERSVTQLGFKGTMINGHTNGEYLDHPKFRVLWERVEVLGVPVYLHVAESHWASQCYVEHPELRRWSWGVEGATHALRIVVSGVFDAFPGATLILGHLGESLPFLLARLDQLMTTAENKWLKKPISEYLQKNTAVTTSGKFRPEALVCTVSAMGADRILFATDYPHVNLKEALESVENAPISLSDKEKIFHLNAEQWLKL